MTDREFRNILEESGFVAKEIAVSAIAHYMEYARVNDIDKERGSWAHGAFQGYMRSLNLILGFETESAYKDEISDARKFIISAANAVNVANLEGLFYGDLLDAIYPYPEDAPVTLHLA